MLMWNSETCPCGLKHQPHECARLDLGPASFHGCVASLSAWAGVHVERDADMTYRDLEVYLFNHDTGDIDAHLYMDPDDAAAFGVWLISEAQRARRARKTRPAVR